MKRSSSVKMVAASSLIYPAPNYPRKSVDSHHASHMAEAIRAGEELPPAIVNRKTREVTDGTHYCTGEVIAHGKEAMVRVQYTDYNDQQEAFRDSVRRNAKHGLRLDSGDRLHCVQVAEMLGIRREDICADLGMRLERLENLIARRCAINEAGEMTPLPPDVSENLAGHKITPIQEKGLRWDVGGTRYLAQTNNLINAIKLRFLKTDNKILMRQLQVLHGLLGGLFGGRKRKRT